MNVFGVRFFGLFYDTRTKTSSSIFAALKLLQMLAFLGKRVNVEQHSVSIQVYVVHLVHFLKPWPLTGYFNLFKTEKQKLLIC